MNNIDVLEAGRFEELESRYRAIDESDQVPIAKLGLYATASLQHLAEYEESFQKLSNEGFLCAELPIRGGRWYERAAARFGTTLDAAVADGTIRAVDTDQVGAMFLDAILSLMTRRTGSADQETIENDVRALMDLYLLGLSTGP